ncbi:RidA family protein [Hydromonas duriensis]|uniref:2-iminobutanoate/2-iminopropanoate deaminase n=1 Tax=Hydromonas duriensis TaxID=1527608 RepID=A0A4R6Y2Z2_9BURK|nr:RidA family protein [Hydromonas duriensis]TDR30914.1 2-iminobutanoate/2-iminopropanoate deaminase [Hydromonas duriensis]
MSKQIISTTKAPAAIGPYSQAVKTGQMVFTSGQLGLDPATGDLVSGVEAQAHQAFKNLDAILQEAGSSLANVVKFTLFLTDLADFAAVNAIMAQYVPEPFPARSTIGVASLPKGGLFEVEAVALV